MENTWTLFLSLWRWRRRGDSCQPDHRFRSPEAFSDGSGAAPFPAVVRCAQPDAAILGRATMIIESKPRGGVAGFGRSFTGGLIMMQQIPVHGPRLRPEARDHAWRGAAANIMAW